MTTDIAIEPRHADWDDCSWRMGVAEIASSGPFSRLPGIERLFVPLGPGVSLAVGGAVARSIGSFEVFAFDGGSETECHFAGQHGVLRAFNLMTRIGRARGEVHCHPGPARLSVAPAGALALFVPRGGFTVVGADGRPLPLDAGEVLVHRDPAESLAAEPYKPWSMMIAAQVWSTAPAE